MDWSYIAGFVDGEGSFSVGNGGKQITLAIAQTEERSVVLDLIAEKLDSEGITYSWYHGEPRGHTKAYWVLNISAQDSLRKIIVRLMPHLIVKRPDAEAAMEFLSKKEEARVAREAQCKYGHPRTPENTYTYNGKKSCLVCRRERGKGNVISVPGYSAP